MSKRRRRRMSEQAKAVKLTEVPIDAIKDAVVNYPECTIRVVRQNSKGHWQTVAAGVSKPTEELASLDEWLRELAGGGRFRIEPFDPSDRTTRVLPPFYIDIEGPPRAVNQDLWAGGMPMGIPVPQMQQQQPAVQNPSFPPWARGLPPMQQQNYLNSMPENAPRPL